MRQFTSLIVAFGLVLVAGCGADKSKSSSNQNEAMQKQVFSSLPAGAVTRVPVQNGKEVLEKAETKLVTSAKVANDSEAAKAWDNGKTPSKVTSNADELDKDSSTQSWYFPSYGYGYNYSYSSCTYSCYYSYYTPYTYSYGYYYPYTYYSTYYYGGYNYYYYNRSCSYYSWCGSSYYYY